MIPRAKAESRCALLHLRIRRRCVVGGFAWALFIVKKCQVVRGFAWALFAVVKIWSGGAWCTLYLVAEIATIGENSHVLYLRKVRGGTGSTISPQMEGRWTVHPHYHECRLPRWWTRPCFVDPLLPLDFGFSGGIFWGEASPAPRAPASQFRGSAAQTTDDLSPQTRRSRTEVDQHRAHKYHGVCPATSSARVCPVAAAGTILF